MNTFSEKILLKTVYKRDKTFILPKFKIGDKVRVSKLKSVFDKSYTGNWSTEIFEIDKIIHSKPIVYHLKDIQGSFYEYELQKTKYPDIFSRKSIKNKRK